MTDAQVEAACATLKRAIEAAENSNQAGEDFVMAAAAAPELLEACEALLAGVDLLLGKPEACETDVPVIASARAAIAKARGAAQ